MGETGKGQSIVPATTKVKGVVDMVLCVDVTGSMANCLEELKNSLGKFITELTTPIKGDAQTEFQVKDWRARILAFRDLFEPKDTHPIVDDFPFVKSAEELVAQLRDPRLVASGGGDAAESSLDAVFRAITKSDWRPETEARRFVVVFTDAASKAEMHKSTAGDGPTDVDEVLQRQKAANVKVVVFAPTSEPLKRLSDATEAGKEISQHFPSTKEAEAFFKDAAITFGPLLKNLARSMSRHASDAKVKS